MRQGSCRDTTTLVWMGLLTLLVSLSTPVLATRHRNTSIRILVPLKLGFQDFISWSSSESPPTNATLKFSGFCIEVFERCVEKLNYNLNYTYIGYGDGTNYPSYDDLLQAFIDSEDIDGVVADVTITKDRWKKVDFTQPYVQSSLRMVVPFQSSKSRMEFWIFIAPFSTTLWIAIVALYIATTIFLFIMEHDTPRQSHRGESLFGKMLWYTTMALFFSQREDVKSHLGRHLTVFWLIAVLIFQSSYTASLSSILAAQQPNPTIASFKDLQKSHLPIGYQTGSFDYDFLRNSLYITGQRLRSLGSEEQFDSALRTGNVSAVIDEAPYIQTFLTTYGCHYKAVDANIAYFGGFGFAFRKGSPFTNDFSLAIITLEQTNDLQNIKDKWLGSGSCVPAANATQYISLNSFGGLFIIIALLYIGCAVLKAFGVRKQRKAKWEPGLLEDSSGLPLAWEHDLLQDSSHPEPRSRSTTNSANGHHNESMPGSSKPRLPFSLSLTRRQERGYGQHDVKANLTTIRHRLSNSLPMERRPRLMDGDTL